jgi:hypothetical protein
MKAFAGIRGLWTKFFAGYAFYFEAPEKIRSPSLKFSRQSAQKTMKYSAF